MDGWYEVTYRVEDIGRYKLHILVNGVAIQDSPYALTISGGRTLPAACVRKNAIPGDRNLPTGTAGNPYSFIIEARDASGRPRSVGGDSFFVSIRGNSKVRHTGRGASNASPAAE